MGSFSLVLTLQRALEDALLSAAAAAAGATTAEDASPAAAAVAARSVHGEAAGSTGSCRAASAGRRPSGLLWDLLRLHHLVVATAASVARCRASAHVPPVADNGDGVAETDDDDDDLEVGGGGGGGGGSGGGDEDSASVADTENGGDGVGGGASSGKGKGKPKEGKRGGEDEEEEAAAAATGGRRRSVVAPPPAVPAVLPASQLLMPPTSALSTPRRPNVKFSSRSTGNGSSSRPKRLRNETPLDKKAAATMAKVKKIRRLQDAEDRISAAELAARASATESATRNRLVLLRAWERLQASVPASAADTSREGSAGAHAGTVSNGSGSSNIVDAGSGGGALGVPPVLQQQHPPTLDASSSSSIAAQRAASERCLREACWIARSRPCSTAPDRRPEQPAEQPGSIAGSAVAAGANGANGGAGGAAGVGVGECLAGPSATPVMDLPREADVRAALSLLVGERENQANGGRRRDGDGPPGTPGAAAKRASAASLPEEDEECLLCGAPVLKLGDRAAATVAAGAGAGSGNTDVDGAVGDGGEGTGAVDAAEATGGVLELPGWAVCRRGHRLRRCMDTLAPTAGVDYRRCEVCRCVLVTPDSFPGPEGDARGEESRVWGRGWGKGSWMREMSACVFCNVLLSSGSSAVNWLG